MFNLEGGTQTDYADAFKSVKTAKNILLVLIVLSLAAQLASFSLVNFVGVVDEVEEVKAEQPTPATAPAEAATEKESEEAGKETMWRVLIGWVLPGTKFMAFISGVLLVLTIMFAVKLCLLGRLGGIHGFMSAFYWAIILLVLITPWQQVLKASFACGALYNYGDLVNALKQVKTSWGAQEVSFVDIIFLYARFIGYPIFALLILLGVQAKLCCGYKNSIMAPAEAPSSEPPSEASE